MCRDIVFILFGFEVVVFEREQWIIRFEKLHVMCHFYVFRMSNHVACLLCIGNCYCDSNSQFCDYVIRCKIALSQTFLLWQIIEYVFCAAGIQKKRTWLQVMLLRTRWSACCCVVRLVLRQENPGQRARLVPSESHRRDTECSRSSSQPATSVSPAAPVIWVIRSLVGMTTAGRPMNEQQYYDPAKLWRDSTQILSRWCWLNWLIWLDQPMPVRLMTLRLSVWFSVWPLTCVCNLEPGQLPTI